jgi:hypothetical protein
VTPPAPLPPDPYVPDPPPLVGPPPPVPPAPPEPKTKPTGADLQADLDLLVYRINTTALTARVMEIRGKKAEAASLQEAIAGFVAEIDKLKRRLEREGQKRQVLDHFLPGDVITHLDRLDFAKLGPDGTERELVKFLGGLKVGTRAKVAVRRGDDFAELIVIYHERPKELYSIIQVAGIIPGQGSEDKPADPVAGPATPTPPDPAKLPEALKVLTDALLRRPAADREKAAVVLRDAVAASRAPAVLYVASTYLAQSDEAHGLDAAGADGLQGYFASVKFAEVEAFDKPRHLAAIQDLKARMKGAGAASSALLLRFAAAHAADSGASEADVQKVADGLGLRRTADDKRWGDAVSVLKANLAAEILAGRPRDTWRRFDDSYRNHSDFGVRLLGAWLLAIETYQRNQGGYDRVASAFKSIGKDESADRASHVDALAAGVESEARCEKCKGGSITCPKCGGDSKLDVPCSRCEGKGKYDKGGGTVMCRDCVGKGVHKDVDCSCARTSGKITCPDCKGKMWAAQLPNADIARVATLRDCRPCDGQGLPSAGVAVPCPACFGLGKILVPASDPKKTLR